MAGIIQVHPVIPQDIYPEFIGCPKQVFGRCLALASLQADRAARINDA